MKSFLITLIFLGLLGLTYWAGARLGYVPPIPQISERLAQILPTYYGPFHKKFFKDSLAKKGPDDIPLPLYQVTTNPFQFKFSCFTENKLTSEKKKVTMTYSYTLLNNDGYESLIYLRVIFGKLVKEDSYKYLWQLPFSASSETKKYTYAFNKSNVLRMNYTELNSELSESPPQVNKPYKLSAVRLTRDSGLWNYQISYSSPVEVEVSGAKIWASNFNTFQSKTGFSSIQSYDYSTVFSEKYGILSLIREEKTTKTPNTISRHWVTTCTRIDL